MDNFKLYLDLLYEIHLLDVAGKGDAEEADLIREKMDAPWHELTELQVSVLEDISVAFYKLDGK